MRCTTALGVLLVAASVANVLADGIQLPVYHRRTQKRSSGTVPVHGDIPNAGEFYVQVGLGSPPQNFWLQIDTGSSDLLVYSTKCTDCPAGAPLFDPTKSSTETPLECNAQGFQCQVCNQQTCGFNDTYGDGSGAAGNVVWDMFTVGGYTANITFGLINVVSKSFETATVEGIWGLAYSQISAWNGATPFQYLVNQLNIRDAFSLCLQQGGGYLQLGGSFTAPYQYTPTQNTGYYTITLNDVKVGGVSLGLPPSVYNNGGAIVDSGTTLLVLPQSAFNATKAVMQAQCNTNNLVGVCNVAPGQTLFDGMCYSMTPAQIAAFPKLTFSMANNLNLDLAGKFYLLPQGQAYCLGIAPIANGGGTILGDIFMQAYNVIFDRQNQQVGFADPSTCGSSAKIAINA